MGRTPLLIIDDERAILEGWEEFLEDEGYEVHKALSGKEGLALFRSVTPQIVITDLRMEGMSGIELIRAIRKLSESVPIVVITGYGDYGSAVDALRLGVLDYISKPVELDDLKTALDRIRDGLATPKVVQEEIALLREQVKQFQSQWKDHFARLSEVEPLIQTGRLLAGIIHNLSNPLTYIMGQAELLHMLHPDIENIGVIETQALRMRDIMATIMKKVAASQAREPEWLQLDDVLREEVRFLESHPYFRAEVEKRWDLDDDLPLFKGILAEFSQVFGNILRNAVEAMKDSRVKMLELRTWHDQAWLYVSIRDSGRGIERHDLERVFEPFFSTKTSEVGLLGCVGMGIGLYHCRELVSHYGGDIEVESAPGFGTTFTVRLPLSYADPSADEREPTLH